MRRARRGGALVGGRGERSIAEEKRADALARPRARELPHVVFTGAEAPAASLDEHDLAGTAARKAWEAMLALDDHASRSAAGRRPTDVEGYLKDTPEGCRGFSAARHARGESNDVRANRRFANARLLPVPPEVDPSGRVGTWAHFKLTRSGMTSPRLHHHDASATTGHVYVSYTGPTCPTGRRTEDRRPGTGRAADGEVDARVVVHQEVAHPRGSAQRRGEPLVDDAEVCQVLERASVRRRGCARARGGDMGSRRRGGLHDLRDDPFQRVKGQPLPLQALLAHRADLVEIGDQVGQTAQLRLDAGRVEHRGRHRPASLSSSARRRCSVSNSMVA